MTTARKLRLRHENQDRRHNEATMRQRRKAELRAAVQAAVSLDPKADAPVNAAICQEAADELLHAKRYSQAIYWYERADEYRPAGFESQIQTAKEAQRHVLISLGLATSIVAAAIYIAANVWAQTRWAERDTLPNDHPRGLYLMMACFLWIFAASGGWWLYAAVRRMDLREKSTMSARLRVRRPVTSQNPMGGSADDGPI
jgi:hypothetical protein